MKMNKHPHRRRALSASLVVVGGILIFLAPTDAWIGTVFALLGAVIELVAFGLAHKNDDKSQ